MSKSNKAKPENEVNAYLFYAQRLLSMQKKALLTENKADQRAIIASVCLSLKQAWQAWLSELSVYLGKDIADYASLNLPENTAYPEVQVLLSVMKTKGSWLRQLQTFSEPRLNTPSVMQDALDSSPEDGEKVTRINILQLDMSENKEQSEEVQLAYVIDEFKSYINAVRSRQAEW